MMAESREFYYPLHNKAEDVDRVLQDLVEITDTEDSVDKYVKVINVEGQPHFSYGEVDDSKPIEVKDWEVPVGDGNNWVKQSEFYITTNKAPYKKNSVLFGQDYHDWRNGGATTIQDTFYFNGGNKTYKKMWTITGIKIDNTNIDLTFETLQEFDTLWTSLLTLVSPSTQKLFEINLDEYVLADILYFDANRQSVSSTDPNLQYGARGLRPKADSSIVTGLLLFSKDGEITFYFGNYNNYPILISITNKHNGNKINTVELDITDYSKGKKVGVAIENLAQYENNSIKIDYTVPITQEVAIGTYGVPASMFFGFNVGKTIGAERGPYMGGIMLKDAKTTVHFESNAFLHARQSAVACFDNCSFNMSGAKDSTHDYSGAGPYVSLIGTTRNRGGSFNGAAPNGPTVDIRQKSLFTLIGKSELCLYEGAQMSASGTSKLLLRGSPQIDITGAPMIIINGCSAPGTISCKMTFRSYSSPYESVITMTFTPKNNAELTEFRNIKVNDTGKYGFVLDIFKRVSRIHPNSITHEYTEYAQINNAIVKAIENVTDDFRFNGTSQFSENGNPIVDSKDFKYQGVGGNRQAYICINGGSAFTMQPYEKSDPCFFINGAGTIVFNNSGLHRYVDYEQYYPEKMSYDCNKSKIGYGPLALAQEDRFYFTGFGSTGAGVKGAPTFADDITFDKSSLIRNIDLENLIKEVRTKGYADYTTQRNGLIHTVWAIGKKDDSDVEGNYFTIENNEKIYLTPNFYKIIGMYYCTFYQGAQEQKFFAGNSIIYLGGESGSNSYIRIGANPGEFTEVNILDNSYIETKMNSSICIRGRDLDNYSWSDIPQDNGGANLHLLDSATFVMRGVWDDSQAGQDDKIPQGLNHLTKKNNTTLFEMTDNAEFRMWGNTKLTIDEVNGITISDGTTTISFSVADLAAALSGGSQLPNAEQSQF